MAATVAVLLICGPAGAAARSTRRCTSCAGRCRLWRSLRPAGSRGGPRDRCGSSPTPSSGSTGRSTAATGAGGARGGPGRICGALGGRVAGGRGWRSPAARWSCAGGPARRRHRRSRRARAGARQPDRQRDRARRPQVVVAGRPARGEPASPSPTPAGGGRPPARRAARGAALARLTGRRRHGHGLAVVRRVAAEHGGRFVLRHSAAGTEAVLELPLLAGARATAGMSRRARAFAFFGLALVAAAVGAAIADGYGASVARGYGPLRPVVVARRQLPAGRAIGPRAGRGRARGAPGAGPLRAAGGAAAPAEALGLGRRGAAPAGSYLLAAQLRPPRRRPPPARFWRRPPAPVEIAVSGAEALLAAGPTRSARGSTSSSPPNRRARTGPHLRRRGRGAAARARARGRRAGPRRQRRRRPWG